MAGRHAEGSTVGDQTLELYGAAAEVAQTPVSKIGRFTIHEKLGAGGIGVVYTAHDNDQHRKVAIKVVGSTSTSIVRVPRAG